MRGWDLQRWGLAHGRVYCVALALLVAGLLVGCGGGSAPTVPSSPAASPRGSDSSVEAVAFVAGVPIPKVSYEHWQSIEKGFGVSDNPGHLALGFLLTSQWVLEEAAARRISVSEAEVDKHVAEFEKQGFPKPGQLKQFFAKSGETRADVLARTKVEMLDSRIVAQITAGESGSRARAVLASFEKAFLRHWRGYTTCKPGYVIEYCSEYRGKPEDLASLGPSTPSRASSRSSNSASSHASSTENASGELPPSPPGTLTIGSPAFGLNGEIPKQYTCDGADISPPLTWQNVPAKAAALVLFVIDTTTSGPAGGIRWVVGDIDPHSKGVAAGEVPQGGIVGEDTQHRPGYGGICPARGTSTTVEFVLYALSKRIPLAPGFNPSIAEREYGPTKLPLVPAAGTYALYSRP
jgi:phosphatidylethanolamine-binding protein (PEBP) family uncharacterized protein